MCLVDGRLEDSTWLRRILQQPGIGWRLYVDEWKHIMRCKLYEIVYNSPVDDEWLTNEYAHESPMVLWHIALVFSKPTYYGKYVFSTNRRMICRHCCSVHSFPSRFSSNARAFVFAMAYLKIHISSASVNSTGNYMPSRRAKYYLVHFPYWTASPIFAFSMTLATSECTHTIVPVLCRSDLSHALRPFSRDR